MTDTPEEIELGKNITKFMESGDFALARMGLSLSKGANISFERLAELAKVRGEMAMKDFQITPRYPASRRSSVLPVEEYHDVAINYEEGKFEWVWWNWVKELIGGEIRFQDKDLNKKSPEKFTEQVINTPKMRSTEKVAKNQKRKLELMKKDRMNQLTDDEKEELRKFNLPSQQIG